MKGVNDKFEDGGYIGLRLVVMSGTLPLPRLAFGSSAADTPIRACRLENCDSAM
jgi:hypothetical protein